MTTMTTMTPMTTDALMESHARVWATCPMHPTPAQIEDVLASAVCAVVSGEATDCVSAALYDAALYDLWMYRCADLRHIPGAADICRAEGAHRYRETGIQRLHRGRPCPGYHRDPVWLRAAYHDWGLTLDQIAERCGVSGATIRKHMIRHGIERRPRGRPCGGR